MQTSNGLPPIDGLLYVSKTIAIFTDGTGNRAASFFKTNVWKLYQALDLGEPSKQIAYYQDGIGTSDIKLLATLGGAFGWGLKRNVIDAYVRLCEVYEPGDRIYLFGFSRGGFTARVLLGLVHSQGLLTHRTKDQLRRYARDAYRAYRHSFDQVGLSVRFLRSLRDKAISLWRRLLAHPRYNAEAVAVSDDVMRSVVAWKLEAYAGELKTYARGSYVSLYGAVWFALDEETGTRPGKDGSWVMINWRPVVKFIGVWDTVSAYGLPIAELTRGIDRWIWPLSFPDNRLPENVEIARQALSLDDEREAFHPLVWDEINSTRPERIWQVWFAGMHADVGGGYPQEGLALIPLVWMMREAEKAGLRFKKNAIEQFESCLTYSAPMNDSRQLFGAYYRYQPRRLDALVEPPSGDARLMNNPSLDGRGLLCDLKIHESVVRRIDSLPDRYAPIVLPDKFTVVRQSGDPREYWEPSFPKEHKGDKEKIWGLVWLKRSAYFFTLFITLLLLIYPFFAELSSACEGPQCLLIPVSAGISNLLPAFLRQWAQGVGAAPLVFLGLLVVLGLLLLGSRHLKHEIHGLMDACWNCAAMADLLGTFPGVVQAVDIIQKLPDDAPGKKRALNYVAFLDRPGRSFIPYWFFPRVMWLRQKECYQQFFQSIRWNVLPHVFGLSVLLLGATSVFAVGAAAILRFDIGLKESSGKFCDVRSDAQPIMVEKGEKKELPGQFETSSSCWPTRVRVEKGAYYNVRMDVTEPWVEGKDIYANPMGIDLSSIGWYKSIKVSLFRRSMQARWFQVLIRISQDPNSEVQVLNMSFVDGHRFAGSFTAGLNGELFLFVNEIMVSILKFGVTTDFYKNNRGGAVVTIERFDING